MKRINILLTVAAFSVLVLGLPAIASAQYGNGGYYPNGGNGGYYPNGNGGYGNNGYYGDIRGTVRDLKDRSRDFERMIDQNERAFTYGQYGNNGYYNKDAYKNLKKLADRFKSAADKLEDKYDARNMNKGYDAANNVLNLGNQMEQSLYSFGNGGLLNGNWSRIQNDLRIVANTYGINYYGNNGYYPNYPNGQNYPNGRYPNGQNYPNGRYPNGRYPNNRNGNWRNRIPFPLPF